MHGMMIASCWITVLAAPLGQATAQAIVAHRGASADAPENTLAAFNLAWAQGADGIEGDFYLTSDGQIVCIHDKDTERTAGKKLSVAESTLEELRQLEYGSWKAEEFRGEQLPTLRQVLACVPDGKLMVIELKTGPEIVPKLKKDLAASQLEDDQILIISFQQDTIAACKEQLPGLRAHWLTSYKQDRATGAWHPSAEQIAETIRSCEADGLGTQGNREVVDADFIAQLRQRGLQEFHVWTIDSAEDARYYQQLGAIGITTNHPATIREALGE